MKAINLFIKLYSFETCIKIIESSEIDPDVFSLLFSLVNLNKLRSVFINFI